MFVKAHTKTIIFTQPTNETEFHNCSKKTYNTARTTRPINEKKKQHAGTKEKDSYSCCCNKWGVYNPCHSKQDTCPRPA
jgi:hypothetical protein